MRAHGITLGIPALCGFRFNVEESTINAKKNDLKRDLKCEKKWQLLCEDLHIKQHVLQIPELCFLFRHPFAIQFIKSKKSTKNSFLKVINASNTAWKLLKFGYHYTYKNSAKMQSASVYLVTVIHSYLMLNYLVVSLEFTKRHNVYLAALEVPTVEEINTKLFNSGDPIVLADNWRTLYLRARLQRQRENCFAKNQRKLFQWHRRGTSVEKRSAL
ncbi:unnamed protein product, partial [Oppiella nova]